MRTRPPGLPDDPRRRRASLVAVAVSVVVSAFMIFLLVSGGGHHSRASRPTATPTSVPSVPSTVAPDTVAPDTVAPSGTPVQEQYDQQFASAIAGTPGIRDGVAAGVAVPTPALGGFPAIAANDPTAWALAFTAGLLDVNYAAHTRAGLEAWVVDNEAPELLPGMPANVADKTLYESLFDPAVLTNGPTPAVPVVSGATWNGYARTRVTQSVAGLLVQVDPGWSAIVDAGWQPTDARMTELDVSGTITVGHAAHHFSVQLVVGSARYHGGYGTSSVTNWTET